ncbi:MAG: protein kinase [Candidatus Eisenbacteria bacterium]|nr:protein kinase [Candidatus Eisenbacteria bacterium]
MTRSRRSLVTRPAPGTPTGARTFAPGDRIAERFQVIRFIARGGMGEVYAARDLVLGEPVALKTIRPEIALDPQTVARFKREVRLARRVTHPNVCRLFDLWSLRSGPRREQIHLVTMELLDGETLDARLSRRGPMRGAAAIQIARQLASALAAAHEVGVVHRDLKSGNVLLVPSPELETDRAVVTDFGLAVEQARRGALHSAAGSRRFAGTPEYMAPEQLAGEPIGIWTDLYALGIVLFELVTGMIPLLGENRDARRSDPSFDSGVDLAELARARLHQNAPSPRRFAPELDPRWESAILRCLERAPKRRFASAQDLLAALPIEAETRPRLVATAALCTADPADAWQGAVLADALAAELDAPDPDGTPRAVDVSPWIARLGLHAPPPYSRAITRRVRALTGADLLVGGSLSNRTSPGGPAWRVSAQDLRSGVVRFTLRGAVADDDPLAPARAAAEAVRALLRVPAHAGIEARCVPAVASRDFGHGLLARAHDRYLDARSAFARAAECAPDFPRGHFALAEVQQTLGELTEAHRSALRAQEGSRSLPRRDQLAIEAFAARLGNQPERAFRLLRTLVILDPESLAGVESLIEALLSVHMVDEALRVVTGARSRPTQLSDLLPLDLLELRARAAGGASPEVEAIARATIEKARFVGLASVVEYAEALAFGGVEHEAQPPWSRLEPLALTAESALRAGRIAEARTRFDSLAEAAAGHGSRNVELRAHLGQARSGLNSGDLDTARLRVEQAQELAAACGDLPRLASALHLRGEIEDRAGDAGRAEALVREATEVADRAGDLAVSAELHRSLGNFLLALGSVAGAREAFSVSLRIARERGHPAEIARSLLALGLSELETEDLRSIEGRIEEAEAVLDERPASPLNAALRVARARLLILLGRLGEAEQLLAELSGASIGDAAVSFTLNLAVARLRIVRDTPTRARAAAARARRFASRVGQEWASHEVALLEAELALLQGAGNVATDLSAIIERARTRGRLPIEVRARLLLTRCYREAGDFASARATLAPLAAVEPESLPLRLTLVLERACLESAEDEDAASRRAALSAALAEAEGVGLPELALEARLAVALDPVNAASREQSAAQVAAEARDRGYLHLARRALTSAG